MIKNIVLPTLAAKETEGQTTIYAAPMLWAKKDDRLTVKQQTEMCRAYVKNPDQPFRMDVDPDAGAVVTLMFKWAAEGIGLCEITRKLEKAKIPTPWEHMNDTGVAKSGIDRYPVQNTISRAQFLPPPCPVLVYHSSVIIFGEMLLRRRGGILLRNYLTRSVTCFGL